MVVVVSSCIMLYFTVKTMDDSFTIRKKMREINKAKFLKFQQDELNEDNVTFPPNPVLRTRIES